MKRVLITGASGFIGRHALPFLQGSGYEVHAVTTHADPSSGGAVRWHTGDLLADGAPAALIQTIQPTHLLHFAWIAEPGMYWTSPLNPEWRRASIELLDAFSASGGARVVVAGTCAEYDWSDGHCIEGVTPLDPKTLYGQCKRDVHRHLQTLASGSGGLSAAWGHIFHLYGPYEHPKRLVSSIILGLLRGERVPCTHGKQLRDFLHVDDVASAFVTLLESDVEGDVNIASGMPVSVRSVVERIAGALEREDLIDWGAIPFPPSEPLTLTAATKRLREEVGWSPHYDLEEGLRETIDWWKHRAQ